jgi:hypothetical protein
MWQAASTLAARLLACPVGWLGKYFPPYAPPPDAPSRVLPGSSLKQHCPPEPCAQVRGPSLYSVRWLCVPSTGAYGMRSSAAAPGVVGE